MAGVVGWRPKTGRGMLTACLFRLMFRPSDSCQERGYKLAEWILATQLKHRDLETAVAGTSPTKVDKTGFQFFWK